MNARLLRMATRHRGVRTWLLSDHPSGSRIVFSPADMSIFNSASVSWPHYIERDDQWIRRGAVFSIHWRVIKREIRNLLEGYNAQR